MSDEWNEKEEEVEGGELPELDDDGDTENFGDEDDETFPANPSLSDEEE